MPYHGNILLEQIATCDFNIAPAGKMLVKQLYINKNIINKTTYLNSFTGRDKKEQSNSHYVVK